MNAHTLSDTAPDWMAQALALAAQALHLSNPNPRVGCVLVSAQGQLLGQGFTQQAGGAHAEVMALRDATALGHSTQGATAYVTLEPCSHHGRTGPCCQALADAGIARLVCAVGDPNPQVSGQGLAHLRAAGVQVQLLPPDSAHAQAAQELNVGFFKRMQTGLPWVRMKAASSLDGATALHNGISQWITSPEARNDGHAWRARACTVLTGMGTILADNPQLNVRALATPRQPRVAVVDSQLRMPLNAAVLQAPAGCWIYTSAYSYSHGHSGQAAQVQALQAQGPAVQVIPLPCTASGHLSLPALLQDLGQRDGGSNEVHLEAGAELNGAFLAQGLVDELLLYLAPALLGQGGKGIADWGPLDSLEQAQRLHWHSITPIGADLRLLARVGNHPKPVRYTI